MAGSEMQDCLATRPERKSRKKPCAVAPVNPICVDLTAFAAMLGVSDNLAKYFETQGWITSVQLPTKEGSERSPRRYFVDDIRALAREFRDNPARFRKEPR